MTATPISNTIENFIEIISQVQKIFGHGETKIKEVFKEKDITRYIDTISNDTVFEIYNRIGTLTCLVNENNRCHQLYLFLHSLIHLEDQIIYCDNTFKTIAHHRWEHNNLLINLMENKTDQYFVVNPK